MNILLPVAELEQRFSAELKARFPETRSHIVEAYRGCWLVAYVSAPLDTSDETFETIVREANNEALAHGAEGICTHKRSLGKDDNVEKMGRYIEPCDSTLFGFPYRPIARSLDFKRIFKSLITSALSIRRAFCK